jgi:hypothetical protein
VEHMFKIDHRYRGPRMLPNGEYLGHGGYFCGRVAQLVPGLSALSIPEPIPLDRDLVVRTSPGRTTVHADGVKIGDSEVRGAPLRVTVPPPISLQQAREAATRFPGFTRHPFPECFACGHHRDEGDGLRIFPGEVGDRVNGEPQLAGVWRPDSSVVDADGVVRPEIVWAALDCPGGWAIPGKCSTVALQAEVLAPITVGQDFIVRGWLDRPIDPARKSRFVGTAVLDASGRVMARGAAIWSRRDEY